MKNNFYIKFFLTPVIALIFLLPNTNLHAQANIGFELGSFAGWTGTYGKCSALVVNGDCICAQANPYQNASFDQGPLNAPSNAGTQYSQTIVSSGNDATMLTQGVTIPCVYPAGGNYSARLGSTTAAAEGETLSYSYVVTAANCNLTYHYAVVLASGGHAANVAPYFHVKLTAGGTDITCADYDINSATVSGFSSLPSVPMNDGSTSEVFYKNWTSVAVPLNAYIGQTVTITFTTSSCYPIDSSVLCGGPHYAYAYIDADVAPLQIIAPSPAICGSSTLNLTAPAGAATYAWTGPGVVAPTNNQTCTINQPGVYTVTMTTFSNNPCTFTIDTTITLSPNNPVANFSAPTVCVGSPSVFTDHSTPVGSIMGWSWNFGDGSAIDSTQQNPTHTYTNAGIYPVELTISWPPCTADTTINVTVATLPTSTFTASPSPLCAGQTCTITYTGNGTAGVDSFAWNFDGGTVISGSGIGPYQVNWSSGGTKNITLTVSAGSCSSAPTTVQVTVTPFPGLTLSPDTSICPGGSATLSVSGATSYTWAPAGSLSSSTAASVVATPATTTTYTVTGNTSSCTVTDIVTVRIRNIPTSTFTAAPSPVCIGQNDVITFTGTASAAATYNWGFDGATVTSGSGPGPYDITWQAGGSETVTLVVTDSSCVSNTSSQIVMVNPVPSSAFTATSPVCTSQNATITYSGVPSNTASYTWVFNGATLVSGTTSGPYVVNWPTAGTKVLTLSVSDNGCTSVLDTVEVIVNAYPVATFTATTSVCAFQNDLITFSGTASNNATYNWNFDGATITSGTTVGPYNVNWTTAGTQYVILSVTDNGCTSPPDTVEVTVNPTPTASFTTITPICTGQTSTITYTGTGTGAGTYAWTFDGGTIISGTTQGPYVIGWATAGSKNVTLAVTENGCTSPVADSTVVVNLTPVAAFSAPATACAGQTTTVTFTGVSDGAAVYAWSFAGGTPGTGTTIGPYQITWPTAGTQNITLSITDNGCTSNDTSLTVTVNPIPPSDAGQPVTFCSGDSAAIGTASTNGYTYLWTPSTGLSNSTIANPYADGTNTTDATTVTKYVVTTSQNGCSSSDSVNVTINPMAVASFNPPAGMCFIGNIFSFQAGGSFLPSATFAWNFGANGVPATSTLQNQSVSFTSPGTQTVSLTISQAGCASSTFVDSVDVYPTPVAAFTPDPVKGCVGLQVCFVNNSTNANIYNWSFGDGQSSALQNPCNIYNAPGVYTVKLAVQSANGCAADTIMDSIITIISDPVAAYVPAGATIQLPVDTITLYNQSLNASTYTWNFGVLGSSTSFNASLTFPESGVYPVILYAYNGICSDSVEHNIIVLPPNAFFIPNVFTPNGDGHNDLFYIEAQEGVTVIHFTVFDRWGEKVHDGAFPWDGTYRGKPCPEGVYVYEFQLGLAGQNNAIYRKGSVTLLK